MKIFHICTISNNLQQYEEMKTSFIAAGFDLEKCRYSLFDNSEKNQFDPYQIFKVLKSTTIEPYIILCHQDLLIDKGDDFDRLFKLLTELDELDPRWAIVGNAGISSSHGMVAKITDPNGTPKWQGALPQQVHSLDENFLVVKTSANIASSENLRGFHLYATDLCLNALLNKQTCYVIDFHLTHLSGGKIGTEFWEVQSIFYQRWYPEFNFCYVQTITGVNMCFSKYKLLRAIGSQQRVKSWLSQSPLRPLVFLD
ncbi:hypothetical protein [Chamaesiphon sp. OTE_8_metabat_110]|uniref:hypothetical protein n=2 Tax=unclassified Chamaesiphon TaxID=2620921 RepID=UPI00286B606B|nr:hypothetical protein [Chamaesiphon sp. OTE_8_metabat_110]